MATLKQCTGINELYKHGAIIPMWLDFIAQPREAMQNKSAIGDTASLMDFNLLTWHPKVQYPGLLENYIHVKFFGRWNVVEKTGIKFIWMGATYNLNNQNENFMVPPAITFFDTQIQTNLNIFIKNDVNNFSIHAGTPIVQIIPLTEKKVDYKCHLVSEKEYLSKFPIPHEFASTSLSRWTKWFKAKNESARLDAEETKSKCPFGFGK
jgi:hypothetical protein